MSAIIFIVVCWIFSSQIQDWVSTTIAAGIRRANNHDGEL